MNHNGATLQELSSHEVPDSQPFPSDEDRAAVSNRWLCGPGLRFQFYAWEPQCITILLKQFSVIHKMPPSACVFKGKYRGPLIITNSINTWYLSRNLTNGCQTLLWVHQIQIWFPFPPGHFISQSHLQSAGAMWLSLANGMLSIKSD